MQMIDYYLITTGFIACDKRISLGCIHLSFGNKEEGEKQSFISSINDQQNFLVWIQNIQSIKLNWMLKSN